MLTIKKTYTDFLGNERTEEFMFNLTKAEWLQMELSKDGGLTEFIKKIASEQNKPAICDIFTKLILKAYGEISADGKYFDKSEAISERFSHTQAFSDIYIDLLSETKIIWFIKGILPADMTAQINELDIKKQLANATSLGTSND